MDGRFFTRTFQSLELRTSTSSSYTSTSSTTSTTTLILILHFAFFFCCLEALRLFYLIIRQLCCFAF